MRSKRAHFEETRRKNNPGWVIIASVAVTAAATLAVSQLSKNPYFLRIQEESGLIQKRVSHDDILEEILMTYQKLNSNKREIFFDDFISREPPNEILILITKLFEKKDKIVSGPLAQLLSIKSIKRYNYNKIKVLLAAEYISGTSIERNYKESINILESPELQTDAVASYYRGIWWLDIANPSRDIERAKIHLRFAASHGIKTANKILQKY